MATKNINTDLRVNSSAQFGATSYQGNMNGGKADFSVDCGGTPEISWIGNYLQAGSTDQNWTMKLYTGVLQTYSQDLYITAGGTGTTSKLRLGTNGQTSTIVCDDGDVSVSNSFLVGGSYSSNSYNSVSSTRLLFGGGDDPNNYHIGTNLENFGGNFTKLDLRWHTGIRMGAQASYGGIRFFNNEDLSTLLFSIGKGGTNTIVESGNFLVSSGNVGIGTSSPNAKLDVNSGISTSSTDVLKLSQATNGAIKAAASLGISIQNGGESTNAADLWFTTATGGSLSERMRITSSGNVGIGTTSPSDKLHVNGIIRTHNSSDTKYIRLFGGNSGNFIDTYGNSLYIRHGGDSNKVILLDAAGNVGIGTTSPSANLDVVGSSKFRGTVNHSWFNYSTGEDTYIRGGKSTSKVHINDSHSADVLIAVGGGNVGIGDTAPFYKLDVNGTLRSTGAAYFNSTVQIGSSLNMTDGDITNGYNIYGNYFRQRAHGIPRNNLGDPTVTEMALFEPQFTCKTDLSNSYNDLTDLKLYVQPTSSESFSEVTTYNDDNKRKFLRTNNSSVVIPNLSYKYRVEFNAQGYTFANALYMYWSSNSHNTQVHIWKQRASDDTWIQHTSSTVTVSSWPGHLWLPFSTIAWLEDATSTSTGHYHKIRIEFTPNWSGHATYGDRDINLYGGQIWGGYPRGRRTPHYYDQNGLLTTWGQFKIGDIPSQSSEATALVVNGSNVVGYRELGSNAFNSTSYLPLGGGTMSGNLTMSSNSIVFDSNNSLSNSFIKSGGTLNVMLDSNNNTTNAAFIIEKDSQTANSGTPLFRVQEDGKVGIGTTSPEALLDIGGGDGTPLGTQFRAVIKGTSNRTLYLDSDSSGASMWWGSGNTPHFAIDSISGGGASFWTYSGGWSQRLTINSSGNVGIGTTSPSVRLELRREDSGDLFELNRPASAVSALYGGVSSNDPYLYSNNGIFSLGVNNPNGGLGGEVAYIKMRNGSTRYTTFEAGNVGIGTTSPSSKLYIGTYGSSINSSTLPTTPANHLITLTPPSTTNYYGGGIGWSEGTNVAASINAYDAGSGGALGLVFSTGNNTTLSEALRIDSAGNVGIGTTNPSRKFEVHEGNVYLKVGAQSGFADGYGPILTTNSNSIVAPEIVYLAASQAYIRRQNIGGQGLTLHGDTFSRFTYYNGSGTVEALRIDNAGNVGIGTTNPDKQLTFVADNDDAIQIRRYTTGQGAPSIGTGISWTWTSGTTDTQTWAAIRTIMPGNGNTHMTFSTKASGGSVTERLRIEDDGNVGIGTTSPQTKLHVQGVIGTINGTASAPPHSFYSDLDSGMFRAAVNTLGFSTGGTERLRINSSGNVGIGTTTPTAPLHIDGGTESEVLKIEADSNPYIRWIQNGTNVGFLQFNGGSAYLSNMANGSLFIRTNDTDKMTITSVGNVGIGTTSPSEKLDVNGVASASSYFKYKGHSLNMSYGQGGSDSVLFDYTHYSDQAFLSIAADGENFNTTSSSEWVASSDHPFAGGKVLQTSGHRYFYSDYIPVTPGEELYGEIYTKYISGSGGVLYYGVERFDSEKNPIGGNTGTTYFVASNVNHTSTSWTKNSGYTTLPTTHTAYNGSNGGGCYYVRIRILFNYSSGGALRQFGGIMLKRTGVAHDQLISGDLHVDSNSNIGFRLQHASRPTIQLTDGTNSGYIGLDSGSAIITGTSDNDLAIRSPRNIVFGGNSIARMSITNAGNVGIGTTSPARTLDVVGDARISTTGASTGLRITTSTSGEGYLIFGDPDDASMGGVSYNNSTNALMFDANNAEHMRITSSGNVGIGTTSPQNKLDVSGVIRSNASNVGSMYLGNTNQSSIPAGAVIGQRSPSNVNTGNLLLKVPTWGTGTDYGLTTQMSIEVSAYDTKEATISMIPFGGKVGIGTTSPAGKLTVYTSANRFQSLKGAAADLEIVSDNNTNPVALIKGTGAADLLNVFDNTTEVFTILDGGNVGIGTTSPAHKLTVSAANNTTAVGFDIGSNASFNFSANSTSGYVTTFHMDNTGLDIGHSSSSRSLNLKTGGADRLVIEGGGNVGIGTTSPSKKLDVNGTIGGNQVFIQGLKALDSSANFLYIDPNTQFSSGIYINNRVKIDGGLLGSYNEDLQLRTGDTTRLTLSSSTGNATFAADVDVNGITTSDAFRTDTSNTVYNVISRNSTSGTLWVQAAQSNSTQTILSCRYGSATVAQGTEVLAVRRNSSYFINTKLGVGMNNPSKTLDVSGEVRVSNGDLEVVGSSEGVILTAPSGGRYRISVNDSGELQTSAV